MVGKVAPIIEHRNDIEVARELTPIQVRFLLTIARLIIKTKPARITAYVKLAQAHLTIEKPDAKFAIDAETVPSDKY